MLLSVIVAIIVVVVVFIVVVVAAVAATVVVISPFLGLRQTTLTLNGFTEKAYTMLYTSMK